MKRISKHIARAAVLGLGLALVIAAQGTVAAEDCLIGYQRGSQPGGNFTTFSTGFSHANGSGTAYGTLVTNGMKVVYSGRSANEGGSARLRAAAGCGLSCNGTTCILNFRRTSEITTLGQTKTVTCLSGETRLEGAAEVWTHTAWVRPDRTCTRKLLGPMGGSFYNPLIQTTVQDRVAGSCADGDECGPLGCNCGPLGCD
jgi:hypothetical protein